MKQTLYIWELFWEKPKAQRSRFALLISDVATREPTAQEEKTHHE